LGKIFYKAAGGHWFSERDVELVPYDPNPKVPERKASTVPIKKRTAPFPQTVLLKKRDITDDSQ
jgi:hypothetical protein